ncbi:MAG TPA: DNA alkylation repair protein [Candidatus Limnocylindrales bacterium]|nr:DNA alkylation repair protein [Candidatus Limnocylindrales bacterium]
MPDDSGARSFVEAHRAQARALGERLAELIDQPEDFIEALSAGLVELGDPVYAGMLQVLSPGVASRYAVRGPLGEAVQAPLRRSLRGGSSASALWLAERLVESTQRDLRLYAVPCLRRSLSQDPEQSWQLMRRMGGRAEDWIETDSLADVWARGILAEPFRWAELEQLVYSARVFERRLVGATLATLPHRVPGARTAELHGAPSQRAFELIRLLMGDAEARVQKALSWAIREWTRVDPGGATGLLREEVGLAVAQSDGARAWVVRDALSGQPADLRASLRSRLAGIRRDRLAPSTSVAAGQAARFAALSSAHADAVVVQGHRYTRSRA